MLGRLQLYLALGTFQSLFSLPSNPNLLEGTVEFHLNSNLLGIVSSDQAVIHWDSFSIEPSEQVSFHLPSSDSAVVNRIIGNSPSEIFGALRSNGQVILINPNGILFGPESRIDVANLLASSFNLFQKGGRIQHAGKITSNKIELMADEIFLFKESFCQADQVFIGDREKTQVLWVEKGSQIYADGFDGGTVSLLSQGSTQFYGFISAKGERNGGFVEVSGGHLCYEGVADVYGLNVGTLLLDPVNITIGPATANNTATPGFTFPLSCGGTSPVSTQNTTTAPFSGSTISVATIAGQIGLGNVIIDSTAGIGGAGNITWSAGADFLYSSPNSLILRAPTTGIVTILSNVQNLDSGSLIIDSLGLAVNINTQINNQEVAFGSINGLTQICAPSAALTLQAADTGVNRWSQVGYHNLIGGLTADGAISIVCNTLLVAGSTRTQSYGFIGHGQMNIGGVNILFSTTANAAINVNVTGNIDLLSSSILPGSGINAAAIIGHGQRSPAPGSVFSGNIAVTSGGNINLVSRPAGAATSVTARIGHGVNGTTGGNSCIANGNVDVQAAGNISMTYFTGGNFQDLSIGHFVATGTASGEVTVRSGGTIQVDGNPGGGTGFRASIGHLSFVGSTAGNVRVFACQDIILNTRNTNVFGIGASTATNIPYVGDVEVAAGRNIQITSNGNSDVGRIGSNSLAVGTTTRTFVAAGNNIDISGTRNVGIGALGDVYVAAGGNINLTSNAANRTAFIGTDDTTNVATPRLTRVFAGGNVIASNPLFGGRAVIGRGPAETATYTCSLDLRAAGDIQLSSPFTTNGGVLIPTSGNIFIEADTQLPAGAFWTAGGAQINTICQVAPNIPILVALVCPASGFSANSPSIFADGRGALRFNTGGNGGSVGLQTTVGNITLHSAQLQANTLTLQDLTIGTGLNNVNILTTSGNIEIWGSQTSSSCVRGDSFNNIIIDQPITTSGSVLISANNNMTMTPLSSITTLGGPITLIVDNQEPISPFIGSGIFDMNGGSSIDTGGGLLQIYTALQNANSINGSLNGALFSPGSIYENTSQEVWCTYFCAPLPGFPFTVSYKDCLQLVTFQAMVVVDEFLAVGLHPYNEFPGWKAEFLIKYRNLNNYDNSLIEPFSLRRRHLNYVNQPKSYTVYF